jgi:hypothetical protein
MVFFTHLPKYSRIDEPKANDIVLSYSISEEHPMVAEVFLTLMHKRDVQGTSNREESDIVSF